MPVVCVGPSVVQTPKMGCQASIPDELRDQVGCHKQAGWVAAGGGGGRLLLRLLGLNLGLRVPRLFTFACGQPVLR